MTWSNAFNIIEVYMIWKMTWSNDFTFEVKYDSENGIYD